MTTRIDTIYEFVLPEMAANNIPDTTKNRIAFMQGLFDAWEEDTDTSLEKILFMLALNGEIVNLQLTSLLDRISS